MGLQPEYGTRRAGAQPQASLFSFLPPSTWALPPAGTEQSWGESSTSTSTITTSTSTSNNSDNCRRSSATTSPGGYQSTSSHCSAHEPLTPLTPASPSLPVAIATSAAGFTTSAPARRSRRRSSASARSSFLFKAGAIGLPACGCDGGGGGGGAAAAVVPPLPVSHRASHNSHAMVSSGSPGISTFVGRTSQSRRKSEAGSPKKQGRSTAPPSTQLARDVEVILRLAQRATQSPKTIERSSAPTRGGDSRADLGPERASTSPSSRSTQRAHIARPPNSFLCFRSEFAQKQAAAKAKADGDRRSGGTHAIVTCDAIKESEGKQFGQAAVSRAASIAWKALDANERQRFVDEAEARAREHRRRFPHYRYSPSRRRSTTDSCVAIEPKTAEQASALAQAEAEAGERESARETAASADQSTTTRRVEEESAPDRAAQRSSAEHAKGEVRSKKNQRKRNPRPPQSISVPPMSLASDEAGKIDLPAAATSVTNCSGDRWKNGNTSVHSPSDATAAPLTPSTCEALWSGFKLLRSFSPIEFATSEDSSVENVISNALTDAFTLCEEEPASDRETSMQLGLPFVFGETSGDTLMFEPMIATQGPLDGARSFDDGARRACAEQMFLGTALSETLLRDTPPRASEENCRPESAAAVDHSDAYAKETEQRWSPFVKAAEQAQTLCHEAHVAAPAPRCSIDDYIVWPLDGDDMASCMMGFETL